MKQLVEMPEVMQCDVKKCTYNKDALCHARAITVGDLRQHLCDTMMTSRRHAQRQEGAGVGACKSTNCVHNDDFECQADAVTVGLSRGQACCATFARR